MKKFKLVLHVLRKILKDNRNFSEQSEKRSIIQIEWKSKRDVKLLKRHLLEWFYEHFQRSFVWCSIYHYVMVKWISWQFINAVVHCIVRMIKENWRRKTSKVFCMFSQFNPFKFSSFMQMKWSFHLWHRSIVTLMMMTKAVL